ncbi:glutamate/leucine/phenylalanine/valine dehydrogenase [Aureococcus anophagefferens]|nr:glutamate/leucine/phenylalanine/valine dehydrogenase [Aureococcus anophagefferens]
MLNASDAFFSVLRPADDRGWARTPRRRDRGPGRSAFWVYEPAANASANALAAAVAASDAWSGSGVMIAARENQDDYAGGRADAAAARSGRAPVPRRRRGLRALAESLEARGDDFYDALVFAGCDGVTTGVPRRCRGGAPRCPPRSRPSRAAAPAFDDDGELVVDAGAVADELRAGAFATSWARVADGAGVATLPPVVSQYDAAGRLGLATSPDECVCYKGACDAAEGDACHPPAGLPGGDWLDGAGTVEPAAATGAYGIWNGSRSAGGGPVCYACPAHGTCRGHYDLPRPARHYATVDYRGVDRRRRGFASRGLLCQRIATGETNIGDLAVRCRGSGGATTYVFQLALTLGMVVCFFFINYLSDQFSALGIFLTHGRSLAIISSVHVVWPRDPVLSFLFGALEATQFDVDVAPPRCVFATWGFRERLALQCGLALGMVAYYVTAKNTSVKLGVLALLMNYPSLCEVAFAALMCEGFEDGEAYLFVHILAIDLVRPHLHRSEALLERTLIATAVVIIAVAAVFAAYGDDPSPAQDARKQALAVVLDVCLLACLSLTAFIVRQNVLQTAATARLVRCLSTLEAACHDAFGEGPSPVVRDGRHRTSSAAAAVKRALGGAERDARTYDFSPDVYATFKPHLILKWARADPAADAPLIEDLIYVDAHVVAECCGDGHDVSTYSISPESSVWRTLTDAFPALFEWLANERSDDAVKQFGALVGRIVELRKRYRYGVAAVVIEEAEKAEKAGRDADDLRRLSMERTRDANAGPVDDGKPAPFFFDEAISAFTHLACATRPSDPGAVFCDSPPPLSKPTRAPMVAHRALRARALLRRARAPSRRRPQLAGLSTAAPKSWVPRDSETRKAAVSALLHEYSVKQQRTAEKMVPWFLRQMPAAYFRLVGDDERLAHLQATAGLFDEATGGLVDEDLEFRIVSPTDAEGRRHITYAASRRPARSAPAHRTLSREDSLAFSASAVRHILRGKSAGYDAIADDAATLLLQRRGASASRRRRAPSASATSRTARRPDRGRRVRWRTPTPFGVIFVHGRRFDGFHVRFRPIARGGARLVTPRSAEAFAHESSRHYDECFNLAHAQQLKNKDIPEGGSKGVVLIDATAPGAGDAWGAQDAADFHDYLCRKSTKAYTDGVLDLCLPGDGEAQSLLPMVYLGPDEQIVPEDINWVVANAKRRGHPTADAFMSSKPDAGVNHKEFGVTSEGVHVFLEAALRDTLGVDPKVDPFTVKLTGGPDGGVAGNAMLILFRECANAKVVGVADGAGVAEDPDGLDRDELARLVREALPIVAFDAAKLGPRGSVEAATSPDGAARRDSMHNRVPADVFVPAGGRPNTLNAGNYAAFLDEDGKPSSPSSSSANLFVTPGRVTPRGRGRAHRQDSSANKCGVICSSYEILSAHLMDRPEFEANKARIVGEILDKLRALAALEADLLFREHASFRGALPEFSSRISGAINAVTDAVDDQLKSDAFSDADVAALFAALAPDHLPKTLAALAVDAQGALPDGYVSACVASFVASRLVYAGAAYVGPGPAPADVALHYVKAQRDVQAALDAVAAAGDVDGDTKDLVAALLRPRLL